MLQSIEELRTVVPSPATAAADRIVPEDSAGPFKNVPKNYFWSARVCVCAIVCIGITAMASVLPLSTSCLPPDFSQSLFGGRTPFPLRCCAERKFQHRDFSSLRGLEYGKTRLAQKPEATASGLPNLGCETLALPISLSASCL